MQQESNVLAVNAREAARLLGVCEKTLWNWSRRELVRTVKVGRRVLYPIAALNEFLGQGEKQSAIQKNKEE